MFAATKTAAAAAGAPPSSNDPQFNYVTMLLHGDGTNGAQNNTFVDSSTNNFTITRNGTPTQGSFSPYGTLWSNNFSGSTQYLTIATNAVFTYASGDFTIEGWAQLGKTGAVQYLVDQRNSGTASAVIPTLYISASNVLTYYVSGAAQITGTTALTVGTWFHFAISRTGTSTKLFLNGVQEGSTYSDSNNYAASRVVLASEADTAANFLQGYLSNVRIVKGTALYTSNFTPSPTPLTAVSGTSLLTCQSNRFIDNSSNNFAITVTGTPSVQRFSPFEPAAGYDSSVIGGSGFFDGNADYLSVASNAASALPGAFTFELWFYPFAFPVNTNWWQSSTSGAVQFGRRDTSNDWGIANNGIAWRLTTTTMPTNNAWNHIVIVRSGTGSNQTSIFLNGVRVANGTVTDSFVQSAFNISNNTTNASVNGYMSDVRLVKGTAVYDPSLTTLTMPTAPLTAITNTSLLLNCVNAGIYDNAMMNDLVTVGNAQVSTTVVKYGTGSMKFNGTTDYLSVVGGDIYNFPGDYTVECWVYISGTGVQRIAAKWNGAGNIAWLLQIDPASYVEFGYGNNGSFVGSLKVFTAIGSNAWKHIAITRSGTTVRMFVDGTQIGSGSNSSNLTAPNTVAVTIGQAEASFYLNGYIDDLRITKGYARYTANFTPPTAALPNN